MQRIPAPLLRRFRSVLRWLLRTLPGFFLQGGALHHSRSYEIPLKTLQWAVKAEPRMPPACRLAGIPASSLRRWRWIRFEVRLSRKGDHSEVELLLEPGCWPGRLLLKLFRSASLDLLSCWHAALYERIGGTGFARPDFTGPHYLARIIHLLCRYSFLPVCRLRLSTIFFLGSDSPGSAPAPFHATGPAWTLSAGLFAMMRSARKKGPVALQIPFIRSVALHLQPVRLIRKEDGHHLHGYLLHELKHRNRQILHRGQNYLLQVGPQTVSLQVGRYGGFEQPFPFHPAAPEPYLFFLDKKGGIHGYRLEAEYPSNHLQRFHVKGQYSTGQKVTPERFCEDGSQAVAEQHPPLHALYLSRMDWSVQDRFTAELSDFLWRPALDAVPDRIPVSI